MKRRKSEDLACRMCHELVAEIKRCETHIEDYASFYHAKEADCCDSFKFLMLINGWQNPFVALNEMLKRIDGNEMLIKRFKKEYGFKVDYKSRKRELTELVQNYANRRAL